jgi:ribose transport system ATP-binding protein
MLATGKDSAAVREPLIDVRNLWLEHPRPTPLRPRLVDNVSFSVAAGEVFGLGGLLGAGRTETLEVLFGLHPATSGGVVRIRGKTARILSPVLAKEAGISLVTEDRKRDGLILGAGIDRNVGLPVTRLLAHFGVVSNTLEQALASAKIAQLNIHAVDGPAQVIASLSGGNQQKVVVGKCLVTEPKILLLDEPTRGIDVGAKAEIYRLIQELAGQGLAIILVTSELPELILLSDRILVLREGLPTAILNREDFSQETILEFASPGGATQPEFLTPEAAA